MYLKSGWQRNPLSGFFIPPPFNLPLFMSWAVLQCMFGIPRRQESFYLTLSVRTMPIRSSSDGWCWVQGFPSTPRALTEGGLLAAADTLNASKAAELRAGLLNLGLAWGLVALCCTHHVGHILHAAGFHEFAHTPFLHALGSPAASATLGALALLGPGRSILINGVLSLIR